MTRHKKFVLDVVAMCEHLPTGYAFVTFSRQLIRSASSMSANYRAACRAKSGKDFINKMKIVEEEADESVHWLDLLSSLTGTHSQRALQLMDEANEFVSITVASIRTARNRMKVEGSNS